MFVVLWLKMELQKWHIECDYKALQVISLEAEHSTVMLVEELVDQSIDKCMFDVTSMLVIYCNFIVIIECSFFLKKNYSGLL
jgi:hypothetical protein